VQSAIAATSIVLMPAIRTFPSGFSAIPCSVSLWRSAANTARGVACAGGIPVSGGHGLTSCRVDLNITPRRVCRVRSHDIEHKD
jgi:hypothetical protein